MWLFIYYDIVTLHAYEVISFHRIMATWDGHLLGSLFLVIQGLWWIFLSIWYHLQSKQKSSKKRSTVRISETVQSIALKTGCSKSWIPQPFYPNIPIEPIAKIISTGIGILGETFLTLEVEKDDMPRRLEFHPFRIFNSSGDFIQVAKFQHVTMYGGFTLSGVIDILILVVSFPQDTSPLFFTLAFMCQGVLFWFHIGHSVLNATYHKLHLVIIILCIIFAYLRTYHIKSFLVNLALGCSILLQGTWFFQPTFLVFKDGEVFWELHKITPPSEKLKHMVPMYLSAVFTWHLMTVAVTVLILWSIIYFIVNKRCIVKWRNSKWKVLQSEYTENLMENNSMTDGNEGAEVDTEL